MHRRLARGPLTPVVIILYRHTSSSLACGSLSAIDYVSTEHNVPIVRGIWNASIDSALLSLSFHDVRAPGKFNLVKKGQLLRVAVVEQIAISMARLLFTLRFRPNYDCTPVNVRLCLSFPDLA
jgi:hypothetical protein